MSNALFPREGVAWDALEREMDAARTSDIDWRAGRDMMAGYFVDEELLAVQHAAYTKFLHENALYIGDVARQRGLGFLSLTRFADEVVSMALEILNGPAGATGTLTTGGSESLLLATLGARRWAEEHRAKIGNPRILLPHTAHPAFNKAAYYYRLEVTRVPVGPDYRANVSAMREALDDDVILMVGSARAGPSRWSTPSRSWPPSRPLNAANLMFEILCVVADSVARHRAT